jgi:hypothetical protein
MNIIEKLGADVTMLRNATIGDEDYLRRLNRQNL